MFLKGSPKRLEKPQVEPTFTRGAAGRALGVLSPRVQLREKPSAPIPTATQLRAHKPSTRAGSTRCSHRPTLEQYPSFLRIERKGVWMQRLSPRCHSWSPPRGRRVGPCSTVQHTERAQLHRVRLTVRRGGTEAAGG